MNDLFKKYIELLDEIEMMKDSDLTDQESSMANAKNQLTAILAQISSLEKSLQDNSPYLKNIIAQEAQKIELTYQQRLTDLKKRQQEITVEAEENRRNLLDNVKVDRNCEMTLKQCYAVLQHYRELLDTSESFGYPTPLETYIELKARMNVLDNHCKLFMDNSEPLCKKIADVVSMKDIFTSIVNPKVAIGAMSVYLLAWLMGVMYFPLIAIAGYFSITAISVKGALSIEKERLALMKEYQILKQSYSNLEEIFKENFQRECDTANKQADEEYDKAIKEYAEDEKSLREDYEKLLEDLKIMETDPTFRADKLSVFRTQMDALVKKKKTIEGQISYIQDMINNINSDLIDMKEELASLRKQIEDIYCSKIKPGTSRLMVDELFLGFEDDGDLRLFEFNHSSTLVLYTGKSVDVSDLCMQIFVQMLREVNISATSFYIFDTEMGAPDFAPFTQDELSDVVHICSTKDQCTDAIKRVHSMLAVRNASIISLADDIQSYNENMIAQNSITYNYVILLIQDSGGAIYDNANFQQLCKSGPRVGIIPIVFVSSQWFIDSIQGHSKNSASCWSVMSSIDNWFSYLSEQDKFISRDETFIRDNLRRLKQQVDKKQ